MNCDDRFWSKVHKSSGCWTWKAANNGKGYGLFFPKSGTRTYAHRYSWELANGPVVDGLLVLHRCDNPGCVRPDHLFLGTHRDNMMDMCSKGRNRCGHMLGESHGQSKLTEQQVLEIRARHQGGDGQRFLAREFGVHNATINLIVHRKTWKHL